MMSKSAMKASIAAAALRGVMEAGWDAKVVDERTFNIRVPQDPGYQPVYFTIQVREIQ